MQHALHPAIEAIDALPSVHGGARPDEALGALPTLLYSVFGRGVGFGDGLVMNGQLLLEVQPILLV